jgi:hypothetical protein
MNLERLAYIVLKVIVKSERKQGQIRSILKQQGIGLSDLDAREIGKFIESKKLGTIIHIPLGEVLVMSNLNAENFVNQLSNMTFEQKLKLIYSELETLPDKKGELETILNRLGIDHNTHIIREIVDSFKTTGYVKIIAESKDGYEIVLTQKGQDNLHAPTEKPVQPNIHIQDNPNSIINIGGSQSGSFDSGIKKDKAVINKAPSENPSNKNKPASPTKTWQIIGVIVSVIGVSLTILKLLNLI